MKQVVIANGQLKEAFLSKQTVVGADWLFVKDATAVPADADLIVDLLFEHSTERVAHLQTFLPRPVFINAVTETLAEIEQPFIRINAWPTFLNRPLTEVAVLPGHEQDLQQAFELLGWEYQVVPDTIGMVSARIIGMIINEAYFTLEEKVSTKDEIDIAMKTGTHYPYGLFEWSRLIGLQRVNHLLNRLSEKNKLYEVSPLLKNELAAINAMRAAGETSQCNNP